MKPLFTALAALSLLAGSAAAQPMDKAAVEKTVKDYIAAHGDELLQSIQKAQERKQLEAFRSLINPQTPAIGPANAKVTIVEFSDFQCPFCARVQPTISAVRSKYDGKVRWAFKQLPLEFHPQAKPAAEAALAAHQQGKFWEYTKQLWANQSKLNDKTYNDIAASLKLDMKRFAADRTSPRIKSMVETDLADARKVDAQGTPYFMINGKPVSGALPADAFEKIIDAELAAKK